MPLSRVPPGFPPGSRTERSLYYQVETLISDGRSSAPCTLNDDRWVRRSGGPLPASHVPLGVRLPDPGHAVRERRTGEDLDQLLPDRLGHRRQYAGRNLRADWRRLVGDRAGSQARQADRAVRLLAPGLGMAGGNLERDLATVCRLAEQVEPMPGWCGPSTNSSRHRRDWAFRTLHREVLAGSPNAIIGMLGLAYKEHTHSTRNSPSLALIAQLTPWRLRVHDPVVSAGQLRIRM